MSPPAMPSSPARGLMARGTSPEIPKIAMPSVRRSMGTMSEANVKYDVKRVPTPTPMITRATYTRGPTTSTRPSSPMPREAVRVPKTMVGFRPMRSSAQPTTGRKARPPMAAAPMTDPISVRSAPMWTR